ncbi:MAG: helix-turn-helix transcriptional regulator [Clostridiales bacterium]|nr:helix-turn-helix transcriptional regulator [Clostridiales bacterium]
MGKRLTQLRGDRTQSEIANAVGVSVSAIGMYESGKRVPRDGVKIALSNYFGVNIQTLFFDDEVHFERTFACMT